MNATLNRYFPSIAAVHGNMKYSEKKKIAQYMAFLDTAYRGASLSSQQLRTWRPGIGSAAKDYDVGEQKTLVARCRDAYRNQAIATAIIDRLTQMVVGPGLTLQSKIDGKFLGIPKNESLELEQEIEFYYEYWSQHCDYEGELSRPEIVGLLAKNRFMSGDIFLNTPWLQNGGDLFGLKLQAIECDRVCNPNMGVDTMNLRDGVEFANNRPVAYWVMRQHPYDNLITRDGWTWDRYEKNSPIATRFIHLWGKDRPCQVRGVPILAPILELLKQLDAYSEAELQATVIAAMFTVFIKSEGSGNGIGVPAGGTTPGTNETAPLNVGEVGLKPGAIVDLAPGEEAQMANPTRPNRAYQVFMEAGFQQAAAAIGVPMESVLLRFGSSYSAARAAMSLGWRTILYHRSSIVNLVEKPIYYNFFDELVARKFIKHPKLADYFSNPLVRYAWTRGVWTGPPKGAIDEEKEVSGAKERIALGVSTLQRESEEFGTGDWIDICRQREIEHKMRVAAGLEPEILAGASSVVGQGSTEPPEVEPDPGPGKVNQTDEGDEGDES